MALKPECKGSCSLDLLVGMYCFFTVVVHACLGCGVDRGECKSEACTLAYLTGNLELVRTPENRLFN